MGIFSIANQHIRFAVKLATAIVLALFVGFHFQLETPRWAVLTAAIVAAGPAFAAGGEPYSGAIRDRGEKSKSAIIAHTIPITISLQRSTANCGVSNGSG
jgi:uncharacterized membrane protein YccC